MKISIIVPVFNVEDYIEECINSILNQSYENIELILVNDGSTDQSPEIMDRFAIEYPNKIKTLHQTNQGQMKATINGLSIATGDYIGFVDSDDFINPDTYQHMMNEASLHDSEIISMAGMRFQGKEIKPFQDKIESGFYDRTAIEEIILPHLFSNHDLYGNRGMQPSKCLKIFKADLIRETYSEIPTDIEMGEDLLTSYTAISKADSISILDKNLIGYNYRLNSSSISWVYKNNLFERSMKLCSSLKSIKAFKDNPIMLREIDYEICFFTINAFLNEYLMQNNNKGKTRKENLESFLSSSIFRSAVNNIEIKEVRAPNNILIKLMKNNRLNMLHIIGSMISMLRKPITIISQHVI